MEYRCYDIEEFEELNNDLKWDAYSELVYEYKRKVKENERQYILLSEKSDMIITLKRILYAIIDVLGDKLSN